VKLLGDLWGIYTLLLLVAFVGIVVWAWSGKRKKGFREASEIPFLDEAHERNRIAAESKERHHE
jgi:cbb3-type cytochrome oxidase subunit 3